MPHLEPKGNFSFFEEELLSIKMLLEAESKLHTFKVSETASVCEIISPTEDETEGKETSLLLVAVFFFVFYHLYLRKTYQRTDL